MKRALAGEQLKFEDAMKFKDAHAIVDWCNTKLSTRTSESSIIRGFFWLVEENDILTQ